MANFSLPDISIISSRLESAESGHFDLLTALGEEGEGERGLKIYLVQQLPLLDREAFLLFIGF